MARPLVQQRVVVTGLGVLSPIANSVPAYWEALAAGRNGAAPITRFDAAKFKTRFACEVKGLDVGQFLDRKEIKKLDLFSQFALISVDEAVQDAKLDLEKLDKSRCGVIWGSGIGGIQTFQDEVINFVTGEGTPRFNPFFIPRMIIDLAAGHISIRYGFMGPNFATVSACATSSNSIAEAAHYIRLGKADLMVAGGSEAPIGHVAVGGFNAMRALSENNEEMETASRPYDKTRDGFVLAEGAGALILESLDHALTRGARIYAELAGSGLSADAWHITAPHPEGLGVKLVIDNALKDADMQPSDIHYINTHGTSTPLGDVAELKAIEAVFGEHAKNVSISSTKSMTGHLLGAAGAIEALACIMAIEQGIIPPTINHKVSDPDINPALNLVFNKAQHRRVDAAMSNTFGFGGHNVSLILKRYSA